MAITAPGLGSGLDVNSIVSQLMTVEKQPLTLLDQKEAKLQAQISAYGSVKSALAAFQGTMSGLASTSSFVAYSARSSSSATAAVAVTGSPVAGQYSLAVDTLAQAQKLVAAGRASETAAIGGGAATTLTFDFGTVSGGSFDSGTGRYSGATFTGSGAASKTVTIDGSDNTLDGIRDAINAANVGLTATIVNDGGASPYRLVLSGTATGADTSLKISVDGDADIAALLAHDPAGTQALSETVTAKNASFTVDGIPITKSSNTVTDAIPGVALTLLDETAAGAPVTIGVASDTTRITTSVNAFAKAYNDLNQALGNLTAYDPSTKTAATLNGDAAVRTLQYQLRNVFSSALAGVPGAYSTLSQIGVAFQADGTLAVDSAKLQSAIASDPNGVAALFAATGSASDPLAGYVGATAATKPGKYALSIAANATQGVLTGSAPAALTIDKGVNDTLMLTVDGIPASVTLPAGTYTAGELATQLQSLVNGASALSAAGVAVKVTQSNGMLTVTSSRYGSASAVELTGGSAAAALFGATPASTHGVDVAGTIGGVAASGSGQSLTGASGTAAEGLKVDVSGGSACARGTLYYSTGFAVQLQALASLYLDDDGVLATSTDGLNQSIKDIDSQRDAFNDRMTDVEARYRAQFTALDTLMSSMNTTSQYLTQQLTMLAKMNEQ